MSRTTLKRDGAYLESCPVIYALNVLSKKWVVPVMCELGRRKVCRFSDILREIDGITTVMLTHVLKDLQGLGIVSRIQYNEMPLRVEYSLTQEGEALMPSLFSLARWGTGASCEDSTQCGDAGCPARNMQTLSAREREFASSVQAWDADFIEGERLADADDTGMDALDKVQFLFEYTLQKNTEDGEELSRLKDLYYVIGEERSGDLLAPDRPAFRILNRYLDEARREDILTGTMTNDEIIYAFIAYKQGIMAYWELERGSFDILPRNRAAISNFFAGLRKHPDERSARKGEGTL